MDALAWEPVAQEEPQEPPPEALARNGRAVFFHVLMGLTGAVLVLNLVLGLFIGALQVFWPDSALTAQFTEGLGATSTSSLFWQTALNLTLFGLLPLAWVYGTRVKPWPGGQRYLDLRLRDFPRASGLGAALGLGLMLAIVVVMVLFVLATDGPGALTETADSEQNPVAAGILEHLTIPLALFISFAAGFGEEVLFRGVLQKWIGWWPQAIVFGLMHAAGGEPLQILVTALIGLLFGYLVHRGASLWLVIAAHFTYDLGLLLATLVAA